MHPCEAASSHLHPHLPLHSSATTTIIHFPTKLTECLMNKEASTSVCARVFVFSPFLTQQEAHSTLCPVPLRRAGLSSRSSWRNGDWMTPCHGRDLAQNQTKKLSSVDWLAWVPPTASLHLWICCLPIPGSTSEIPAGCSEADCPLKLFEVSPGNLALTTHLLGKTFSHTSCKGKPSGLCSSHD